MSNVLRAAAILAIILPAVAAGNRPEWIKRGVVAASSMESLSFVLRRGGQSLDAEREWLSDRTEAAMVRFKKHGINLLVLNLHKGGGLKAEASDIEATRKAVELAHAQGIKVVGYVGASIFYETLPSEEPDAKNWIQVDEFGRPIYYTSEQTFRIMACRNNPGYQEFTRKVIRAGIKDLQLDGLHFDQMRWHAEPSSCRCRYCSEQFREFIARRYSTSGMRHRFGFERLDGIIPPPFGLTDPPVRLPELRNPLMQEWALFRSESLARRFREIEQYIHELNPSAFFQGNPTMHLDSNVGFIYGIDHAQLLKIGAMLWCEDANQAAWTRDGRLVSKIRSYKALRTMGNSLLAWQDYPSYQGSAELRAAEALAFGDRNLGVVAGSDTGYSEPRATLQPIIDFFWSRGKALSDTVEIADAAVLRSFASIEFNPARANVSTTLFEQSLIQARVPFAIIFDDQLRDLRRYKVLVVADQDALSNDQIALIRGFVEAGGGLVATGDTSMMTEWRLRREKFGLAELFGFENSPPGTVRRTFGKGRVVYLPRVDPSIPPPSPQMNYSFGNRYWKLPVNHAAMIAAVRWAAGGSLSIEVEAPPAVVVEVARQPGTNTVLVHLLNYDAGQPAENVRINYRIPGGSRLREVLLDDPEIKAPRPLNFELQTNVASFVVPRLRLYRLALLRLE
jgi:hypothetical protein